MTARLSSKCGVGQSNHAWESEKAQRRSLVLVRVGAGKSECMQMSRSAAGASTCLNQVSPSVLGISTQPPSGQRLEASRCRLIIGEGVARLACWVFIPKGCLGVTKRLPGRGAASTLHSPHPVNLASPYVGSSLPHSNRT